MGNYSDTSIINLIEKINEDYFLPDIQREFVWTAEDKIYDFFDSILRGYPIGTLLFWETKLDTIEEDNITVLKFISKSTEKNESVNKENLIRKKIILVLDGQQRLTTLYLAFNGCFEDNFRKKLRKRYLYFNLLSNNKNKKEINERNFEFKLIEDTKPYFLESDKLWHRVSLFWKNCNEITKSQYRKQIIKDTNLSLDDQEDIISDNILQFNNVITHSLLSYYMIDENKNDEEALEIFVRVNSGGEKLTKSDLLFSKIKQYWKDGSEVINAREEFDELLNNINGVNEFDFDKDFILKTALVITSTEIKYNLKSFNKETVFKIKDNWNSINKSINCVVRFAKSIGINNSKVLSSTVALIPLIYYVFKNDIKEIDPTTKDYSLMKKYTYIVLLNSVYSSQTDQLLSETRATIDANKESQFPLQEILKILGLRANIRKNEELYEFFKNIKYQSSANRLLLNLLYPNINSDYQEDHMYPRSKMLKKYDRKLVNNIGNIQPLGAYTNKNKTNMKFSEWLSQPNRDEEYKQLNYIPEMISYDDDHFEEFIEKRRQLIFERLKTYLDF